MSKNKVKIELIKQNNDVMTVCDLLTHKNIELSELVGVDLLKIFFNFNEKNIQYQYDEKKDISVAKIYDFQLITENKISRDEINYILITLYKDKEIGGL